MKKRAANVKTHEMIHETAWTLDFNGRKDVPIRVRGARGYLMRWFKPKERGGPLYCGEHEIILLQRSKEQPEQADVEKA